MACHDQIRIFGPCLTACPHSFKSGHSGKHPHPKSGWHLDQEKLGCTTSCQGGETNPSFCVFFLIFVPDPRLS